MEHIFYGEKNKITKKNTELTRAELNLIGSKKCVSHCELRKLTNYTYKGSSEKNSNTNSGLTR